MNLVDLGNVSSGVCQVRKCLQMGLIFFFFAFKPKHLIQEQWFIHVIPKKLTQSLQSQRLQERWQRSKEYFERLPELMTGWHPESCKCLISIWKDKRSDFYISSSAMLHLHLTLSAATLFFFLTFILASSFALPEGGKTKSSVQHLKLIWPTLSLHAVTSMLRRNNNSIPDIHGEESFTMCWLHSARLRLKNHNNVFLNY